MIDICDQNMIFTSLVILTYLASYKPQAETDFFKATSDNYSSLSDILANNYFTFYKTI